MCECIGICTMFQGQISVSIYFYFPEYQHKNPKPNWQVSLGGRGWGVSSLFTPLTRKPALNIKKHNPVGTYTLLFGFGLKLTKF